MSLVSKMFNEEVRTKKRAASGVHSKKGKRGYVGVMKFPFDLLSGKEKREYKKAGKVVSYNMYETIMEYEDFKVMPEDRKKEVLEKLRENKTNKEIREKWGIASQTYYNIVNGLGIKKRETKKKLSVHERKELTDEELETYKMNLIDYDLFTTLVHNQAHELLTIYLAQFSAKELAELWKTNVNNVYRYKSTLSKKLDSTTAGRKKKNMIIAKQVKEQLAQEDLKRRDKKIEETQLTDKDVLTDGNDSIESTDHKDEDRSLAAVETRSSDNEIPADNNEASGEVRDAPKKETVLEPVEHGFNIAFEGKYTKEQLKKKLQTMIELLEDDDRFYKLEVQLDELELAERG